MPPFSGKTMPQPRVLVIDNESSVHSTVEELLAEKGLNEMSQPGHTTPVWRASDPWGYEEKGRGPQHCHP